MSLTAGAYHSRTKHAPGNYAKGPEALDWSGQPDPFRRFTGCELFELPLLSAEAAGPAYSKLFSAPPAAQPLTYDTIAALLELSLAISAWKSYRDDRWALRCNPSSGNLHPTEGYLICSAIPGIDDGCYHYRPDLHAIEQRAAINFGSEQPRLYLGLSSILWREGWKYGERAMRYCQLDIGHAIGAISYAAATLGWRVVMHDHLSDTTVSTLLGLDQKSAFANAEPEIAELLLEITPDHSATALPEQWISMAGEAAWQGVANRLDPEPYGSWPILDQAAVALHRDERGSLRQPAPDTASRAIIPDCSDDAAALIRQRRSAQAFEAAALMPKQHFLQLLDATLQRAGVPPWPLNATAPATHLLLFVHRVAGLRQGLYALPSSADGLDLLKQAMRDQFLWEPVADAPASLPLYALLYADCRRAAGFLSCQQPIAADSCFAVSMVAQWDGIDNGGHYRSLLHEAGLIGQSLYLEAEACGMRGTGIGCYFDDAVHETFGLQHEQLQSIYHFTVGLPLIDPRIESEPPYQRSTSETARENQQ